MLNSNEILELLACDCERYVNASKDALDLPCYIFSQDEVLSPKFYVEDNTKSEHYVSSFGGVYENSSNVNRHDD